MNVIFMGTPEFAVPSLMNIINSTHKVVAVFTQKPKPKGRGLELAKSPIHSIADEHGITVHTPSTLRSDVVVDLINSINADIIVVAAYGFILPKAVLESKKYGCINLHPSRLPRFRGAAPLQHTIISRDKESSICIIQMDEGMDTGDILLQKDFNLPDSPTLKWLHDYTSYEGGKMIVQVLDDYENLPHIPQSEDGVVLAPKLRKEDSKINWNQDAFEIEAKIRGYSAWPGSFMSTNIGDIKIIEAVAIDYSHNSIPSTILDQNSMIIACAKNALKIELIRNDSGKLVSISDFINGLRGKKINTI